MFALNLIWTPNVMGIHSMNSGPNHHKNTVNINEDWCDTNLIHTHTTGAHDSRANSSCIKTLSKQGESEWAFGDANKVRGNTFTWENRGAHYSNNYLCQTNLSTKLLYRVIPFQKLLWQKHDIILLEWLIERGESQSDSYFISAMETSSV